MSSSAYTEGPRGHVAAPKQLHVALTSAAQLEQLYERSLSRGTMFVPRAAIPVGGLVEIEVALESLVSITLLGRVTAHVSEPRPGLLVAFPPLNPFELEAVLCVLRETEAAHAPAAAAPAPTTPQRSTQPITADQQRLVRLELDLARARVDLEDGDIDKASLGFERVLEVDPACRDAIEGLVEASRRLRESMAGRLDALLGRSRPRRERPRQFVAP